MNRRLYFVFPNVEISQLVERELLLSKVSDDHMHFLGKRGTDMKDLPEATTAEKTDFMHGAMVGMLSGALAGALIGLVVYMLRAYIFPMQMGIILLFFLLGGVFGIWVSGALIGSSTPNAKLKEFEHAFQEGHILLMVDVPVERVEEIRNLVLSHHPEAEDHGRDPIMPAFP